MTQTLPLEMTRCRQTLQVKLDTTVADIPVRVKLNYDSVPHQSQGTIEGFSRRDVRWNTLETLSHPELEGVTCRCDGYHDPSPQQRQAIQRDAQRLLASGTRLLEQP